MGFMQARGLDPTARVLSGMLRGRGYRIGPDELSRQLRHEEEPDPSLTGAISAVLVLDDDEVDAMARPIFRDARGSAGISGVGPAGGARTPPRAYPT